MKREETINLTQPMYYVLLSLTEERYGYEIMQTIEEFTQGRVIVGPGTLYNLLSRFQNDGLINQVEDDGRRKTYIITDYGRQVVEEEIARLKQVIKDGEGILYNLDSIEKNQVVEKGIISEEEIIIEEVIKKEKIISEKETVSRDKDNDNDKEEKVIFKRPNDILF